MDTHKVQQIIQNACSILKDSKKYRSVSGLPLQAMKTGPILSSSHVEQYRLENEVNNNARTKQKLASLCTINCFDEISRIPVNGNGCICPDPILKTPHSTPKSVSDKRRPKTATQVCCLGKCKCNRCCLDIPREILTADELKHGKNSYEKTQDDLSGNISKQTRLEMSSFKPLGCSKKNKHHNYYEINDPTFYHHADEKFHILNRSRTSQYPMSVVSFIPPNGKPKKMNFISRNNVSNQELRPQTASRLLINKDPENAHNEEPFCTYKQSSVTKEPCLSSLIEPEHDSYSQDNKLFWSSSMACSKTGSNYKLRKNFGSKFRLDGSVLEDFKVPQSQQIEIPKYIRHESQGQDRNFQEHAMVAKRLRKKIIRTGVDQCAGGRHLRF